MKWFIGSVALLTVGCTATTPRSIERSIEGSYDVETRYDVDEFAGNFTSLAGDWASPDTAIQREIQSGIQSQYGDTIATAFNSIYGQQLLSDIQSYIENDAPAWISDLGDNMALVDRQMTTIDMQQSWLVAPNDDQELEATQIMNGIAVFEDPDCPGSGAILCDQIELNASDLLNAEYPIEVISTRYSINDNGSSVDLGAHEVNANYGRLGLFYLTNIILPDDPSNEDLGLRDVALGAINCRGLAGRITGGSDSLGVNVAGVNVGVSLDDLIGDCSDGVAGTVTRFIDGFQVPLGMELSGSGETSDTNRDGAVDNFTSGRLGGDMKLQLPTNQKQEGAVNALFTGFRVNP